jgi:hypothetical protein
MLHVLYRMIRRGLVWVECHIGGYNHEERRLFGGDSFGLYAPSASMVLETRIQRDSAPFVGEGSNKNVFEPDEDLFRETMIVNIIVGVCWEEPSLPATNVVSVRSTLKPMGLFRFLLFFLVFGYSFRPCFIELQAFPGGHGCIFIALACPKRHS